MHYWLSVTQFGDSAGLHGFMLQYRQHTFFHGLWAYGWRDFSQKHPTCACFLFSETLNSNQLPWDCRKLCNRLYSTFQNQTLWKIILSNGTAFEATDPLKLAWPSQMDCEHGSRTKRHKPSVQNKWPTMTLTMTMPWVSTQNHLNIYLCWQRAARVDHESLNEELRDEMSISQDGLWKRESQEKQASTELLSIVTGGWVVQPRLNDLFSAPKK